MVTTGATADIIVPPGVLRAPVATTSIGTQTNLNSGAATGDTHTAAVQKLGLDNEALGEVLAVVGLYNQMNRLADAYQVEPDILPKAE